MDWFQLGIIVISIIIGLTYFFASEQTSSDIKKNLNFVGGAAALFSAVFWYGNAQLGLLPTQTDKILHLAALQNDWAAISACVAALCFIPVFMLDSIGVRNKK